MLPGLARRCLVPASVIREVLAGAAVDPRAKAIAAWARPFLVADVEILPSIAAWELGMGEAQAIAAACQSPAAGAVVLDDQAGRRCALAHGLKVVGTVGLVLRAKQSGLIEAARPVLERLVDSGMFLEASLVQGALAQVGE